MNYITTRKIKVVGCLNCPYHAMRMRVINQETNEVERTDICKHPSFETALPIDGECIEDMKSGKRQVMRTSYFPDWCPLEIEGYVCCCTPVN